MQTLIAAGNQLPQYRIAGQRAFSDPAGAVKERGGLPACAGGVRREQPAARPVRDAVRRRPAHRLRIPGVRGYVSEALHRLCASLSAAEQENDVIDMIIATPRSFAQTVASLPSPFSAFALSIHGVAV